MSVRAMAWAWRQQTGSTTRKAVLVAIADHADDDGICWPGRKKIAAKVEADESTVRRAVRDLEGMELVSSDAQFAPNGARTGTRYVCHLEAEQGGEALRPVGGQSERIPQAECLEGEAGRPPNRQENHQTEPSTELSLAVPKELLFLTASLNRVVEGKTARALKLPAVLKACRDFADRDLAAEIDKFEHYWLDGAGENRDLKDVAGAWRNWLRRAPRANRRSGGKIDRRVAQLLERAAA